jgi:hypothetical protein
MISLLPSLFVQYNKITKFATYIKRDKKLKQTNNKDYIYDGV